MKYEEKENIQKNKKLLKTCENNIKLNLMEKSILEEASEIRAGSRNSDYGDAVECFERIAAITKLLTSRDISAEDCVAVLIAVKLSREAYKHKRDNLVDLCGYADIWHLVKERANENQ